MATVVDDCVVFAGQSNGITFFPAPNTAFPGGWSTDAGILIWNGNGAPGAWNTYIPNTNSNTPGVAGGAYWGPEAEFARQWRLGSPRPLRIVKYCIGSTGIVHPFGGKDWSAYTGGLFSDLRDEIVNGVIGLPAGTVISIKAFVWIGNESDTADATEAGKVQRELQMWFEGIRDVTGRPNARGIVALCKDAAPNGAFTSIVRGAQRYVGLLPRNAYADQANLTFANTVPGSHLTPASVVQHGADLYRAFNAAERRVIPS
jgi:hypothetical protein